MLCCQEEAAGRVQGAPAVGPRGAAGAEAAPGVGARVGGRGAHSPAHAARPRAHGGAARALALRHRRRLSPHAHTAHQVPLIITTGATPIIQIQP